MKNPSQQGKWLLTVLSIMWCSIVWAGDAQLWILSGVTPHDSTADGSIIVGENGGPGNILSGRL